MFSSSLQPNELIEIHLNPLENTCRVWTTYIIWNQQTFPLKKIQYISITTNEINLWKFFFPMKLLDSISPELLKLMKTEEKP